MAERRVVITGMDAITPAGAGIEALWTTVATPIPMGGLIDRFDVSRNASKIGAAIPDFDPVAKGLSRAEASRMDRSTQLAVLVARGALQDAGIDGEEPDPTRVGVCIG